MHTIYFNKMEFAKGAAIYFKKTGMLSPPDFHFLLEDKSEPEWWSEVEDGPKSLEEIAADTQDFVWSRRTNKRKAFHPVCDGDCSIHDEDGEEIDQTHWHKCKCSVCLK